MILQYLRNPYILAGTIGLVYYVFEKKKIDQINPVKSNDNIPKDIKDSVKKMSKDEIKESIKEYTKLLQDGKVDKDTKSGTQVLLSYLTKEYAKR